MHQRRFLRGSAMSGTPFPGATASRAWTTRASPPFGRMWCRGRPAKLRLNLFQNVEYEASLGRSAPTASGYTLSGPLDGIPFGRVVLVVNDGITMGRVYTPGGNWSIRTVGEMQTVEPMASGPLRCGMEAARGRAENGLRARYAAGQDRGEETLGSGRAGYSSGIDGVHQAPPLEWAHGKGTASERSEDARKPSTLSTSHSSAAADGDTVDVLVVYPSFARELEGGYGPMLSLIDLDIATANEAYAASGCGTSRGTRRRGGGGVRLVPGGRRRLRRWLRRMGVSDGGTCLVATMATSMKCMSFATAMRLISCYCMWARRSTRSSGRQCPALP